MAAAGPESGREQGNGAGQAESAPGVADAFGEFRDTGRATLRAGHDAFKAFRILFAADVSLARSALGRMLAMAAVAIAFGGSCWLLLMAALVTWLSRGVGLPFALSLLLCALLSAGVTAWAAWRAMRYFEHTRLQATRRQLARLGIGELADCMPDAESGESGRDAAAGQVNRANQGGSVKNGRGIDSMPP